MREEQDIKSKKIVLIIGLVTLLSFNGCDKENQITSEKDYQVGTSSDNEEDNGMKEIDGFVLNGYNIDEKYIRLQNLSGQWGVLNEDGKYQILTEDDYDTLHLYVID